MAELTSAIYADSLFDVSENMNLVDQVSEELQLIKGLFEETPLFYELYTSPQILREEKKKVINEVFGNELSPVLINLLYLLIDKRRTREIYGIVKQYVKLVDKHRGVVSGMMYLAQPCSEAIREKVEAKLSEITEKNIRLKVVVDPTIVGGVKVQVGDQVVDTTIATQLSDLRNSIDSIII